MLQVTLKIVTLEIGFAGRDWFCWGRLVSRGEIGFAGGDWFHGGRDWFCGGRDWFRGMRDRFRRMRDWFCRVKDWFGGVRDWFRRVRDWFRGVRLVSWGDWFLVTYPKIFIIILVVKQITYNAKISDITILWFFKETNQMTLIGKKGTRKMSQGKLRMKYPTWVNHNTEKKTVMFNSSSTSLSF